MYEEKKNYRSDFSSTERRGAKTGDEKEEATVMRTKRDKDKVMAKVTKDRIKRWGKGRKDEEDKGGWKTKKVAERKDRGKRDGYQPP